MSTRTKRCDRLHPDEPAEMRYYDRTPSTPRKFESCAKCMRLAARIRKAGGYVERTRRPRDPYGVLPRLTWTPPEMVA